MTEAKIVPKDHKGIRGQALTEDRCAITIAGRTEEVAMPLREAMDAARPFLRQPSPVIWRALGVRP